MKAGFALSRSNRLDITMEYFVEHENDNVFEINEALFAFAQNSIEHKQTAQQNNKEKTL